MTALVATLARPLAFILKNQCGRMLGLALSSLPEGMDGYEYVIGNAITYLDDKQ